MNASEPSPPAGGNRWAGPAAIVAIFVVAIVMAGFAWRHRYLQSRLPLELWGAETAQQIQSAPSIVLHEFAAPLALNTSNGNEPFALYDHQIAQTKDITSARGLLHARRSLVENATFDWSQTRPSGDWRYAVKFSGVSRQEYSVLLFTTDCDWVGNAQSGKSAAITPQIAGGLKKLFESELAAEPETSSN